jgi:hypothetical protein
MEPEKLLLPRGFRRRWSTPESPEEEPPNRYVFVFPIAWGRRRVERVHYVLGNGHPVLKTYTNKGYATTTLDAWPPRLVLEAFRGHI